MNPKKLSFHEKNPSEWSNMFGSMNTEKAATPLMMTRQISDVICRCRVADDDAGCDCKHQCDPSAP